MQLDRKFVKSLNPPLSDVLPHGEIAAIAEKLGRSVLTARNAIHGASTNEKVIRESLKTIIKLDSHIEAIFKQVPADIIAQLREEIGSQATA